MAPPPERAAIDLVSGRRSADGTRLRGTAVFGCGAIRASGYDLGALVLDAELHFEAHGWPAGEPDASKPRIHECMARGGAAWGAFAGDRLIGIAVLDGRRIGINLDTLDMYFLHTSNGYRGRGVGEELVRLVRDRATELGARRLYVSSTPSANSVNF